MIMWLQHEGMIKHNGVLLHGHLQRLFFRLVFHLRFQSQFVISFQKGRQLVVALQDAE